MWLQGQYKNTGKRWNKEWAGQTCWPLAFIRPDYMHIVNC
jgi:hypothetical protein